MDSNLDHNQNNQYILNDKQEKENNYTPITPIVPTPTKQNDNNYNDTGINCKTIWCWLIQILLWLCLLSLFPNIVENSVSIRNVILTSIVYFLFIFNNFYLSNTNTYLDHVVKLSNLKIFMNRVFKSTIEKKFTCENWHNVSDYFNSKNKKKVISSTVTKDFIFNSWRDTSGSLVINTNSKNTEMKKPFIKIKFTKELLFADDEFKKEYLKEIEKMKEENKGKDECMDFDEKTKFELFDDSDEHYVLIKLDTAQNFLLSSSMFFLFSTIIPVAEFYKMYFYSKCHYQEFNIKKTISSGIIHDKISDEYYSNSIPKLVIDNEEILFQDAKGEGKKEENKIEVKNIEVKKNEVELSKSEDDLSQHLLKK